MLKRICNPDYINSSGYTPKEPQPFDFKYKGKIYSSSEQEDIGKLIYPKGMEYS